MVEIIPAVLPKSFSELEYTLARLRGISRKVQIDLVGGGLFSFNRSWPFRDKASFTNMLEKKTGLPYWTEFDIEVDLMVNNPKELARTFVGLHVSRVILHARFEGALEAARMLDQYEDNEHPTPVGVGIALAAHAAMEEIEEFEGLYDFVQVMGIDHIGRQGQPPCPHHKELELIRALRTKYPEMQIQVDGGAAAHPQELAQAGANRLVVGSGIVRAKDPAMAYKQLYTEVNG